MIRWDTVVTWGYQVDPALIIMLICYSRGEWRDSHYSIFVP